MAITAGCTAEAALWHSCCTACGWRAQQDGLGKGCEWQAQGGQPHRGLGIAGAVAARCVCTTVGRVPTAFTSLCITGRAAKAACTPASQPASQAASQLASQPASQRGSQRGSALRLTLTPVRCRRHVDIFPSRRAVRGADGWVAHVPANLSDAVGKLARGRAVRWRRRRGPFTGDAEGDLAARGNPLAAHGARAASGTRGGERAENEQAAMHCAQACCRRACAALATAEKRVLRRGSKQRAPAARCSYPRRLGRAGPALISPWSSDPTRWQDSVAGLAVATMQPAAT